MTFEGILIGTAVLWGLSAFVVQPLTVYLLENSLKKEPQYVHLLKEGGKEVKLSEGEERHINSLATKYFILSDTAVLGIAGFLIGVFSGYFFVGFTWEAKGWPGMIAFIASSIIGSALKVGGI